MWPNLQETADLVKFTEEILNRKLHFLCSECRFLFHIMYLKSTSTTILSYINFLTKWEILKNQRKTSKPLLLQIHKHNCLCFGPLGIDVIAMYSYFVTFLQIFKCRCRLGTNSSIRTFPRCRFASFLVDTNFKGMDWYILFGHHL